jgi:hypothetical protein
MTVWHGSPYKFTNFDASKIGSGEGAQVYGHGIYVAQNPDVAKNYKDALKLNTNRNIVTNGEFMAKKALEMSKNNKELAINLLTTGKIDGVKVPKFAAQDSIDQMHAKMQAPEGAFYKIDLPDEHIEKMLDWDKPLSKQPKNVQEALKGIETNFPEISDFNLRKWMDADPLASTWHNTIVRDLGVEPKKISNLLQKRNVAGIKYLDQNSRNAKEGTRNFVVFPGNESILKIQDINGNPIK